MRVKNKELKQLFCKQQRGYKEISPTKKLPICHRRLFTNGRRPAVKNCLCI